MKASEICIGDWFKAIDYNSPFRITAIYDDVVQTQADYQSEIDGNWYSEVEIKDLVPIELTSDILVKNGFEKCHNDEAPVEECYFFRLFNKQCGWLDIDAFGLEEELGAEFTYHDINIHYVHQLQHLLRLCGIEKELTI